MNGPQFRFRIWSTTTGDTVYEDSQDGALYVFNTQRVQLFDRIDYKCVGDWHGWRIVSGEVLNNFSIQEIYRVDKRFDSLRALIYIVAGTAFAAIGAAMYFA